MTAVRATRSTGAAGVKRASSGCARTRHARSAGSTSPRLPATPAIRIDLDPQIPVPEVTVTRDAHSPGELLLDVMAARILTSAQPCPRDNLEQLAAGPADLRALVAGGPGDIVAALHAAGALPRPAPSPASSPDCAPGSVSAATALPRRPPRTCPNHGAAC